MASRDAVVRAMEILGELYAEPVDPEQVIVWETVLAFLDDEEVLAGAIILSRTRKYSNFPIPADLIDAVPPSRDAVDPEELLEEMEQRLSGYMPTGSRGPSVDDVRRAYGDSVALAYSAAGGALLFSRDDTTRSIARREFRAAMKGYRLRKSDLPALPAPNDGPVIYHQPRISSGGPIRIADGLKKLKRLPNPNRPPADEEGVA